MPTECVCPPGVYGRCAHCRSRLALRFAEASYQASKAASGAKNGMRMRDARPHAPPQLIPAAAARLKGTSPDADCVGVSSTSDERLTQD